MYLWKNNPSELADFLRQEVTLETELAPGAHGTSVRRVQEWLKLNQHAVKIDADYGSVTAEAVARFQSHHSLPSTGKTDAATFARLSAPLREALRARAPVATNLNEAVLEYARAHLAEHPLEVGGQNRGPWVRSYMAGREGPEWLWCAGFVSFILRQAAESLGVALPIAGSFSCDTLAAQAKSAGLLLPEARAARHGVPAGSLFLVRRTDSDWKHVGFVEQAVPALFRTIEGNSNDAGEREGYEVCSISRGYSGKDFILLSHDG